MDSERRKRLVALYAQVWRLQVLVDEERQQQLGKQRIQEKQLFRGFSKRMAMLILVGMTAAILLTLLVFLK